MYQIQYLYPMYYTSNGCVAVCVAVCVALCAAVCVVVCVAMYQIP